MTTTASDSPTPDGTRRRPAQVALEPCGDGATWDRLLDGLPGATAFHTWGWLRLQAAAHGWRFEPLLAEVAGVPVGVVPVLLVRKGPLWVGAAVPFPYVGPVVPQEHLLAALRALDAWARRHRVAASVPEVAPGLRWPRELGPGAGWETDEPATLVVDLSHGSPEEFWRRAHKSVPNTMRRAERRGVVVRPATREEVVAWLPPLLAEAYGARGIPSPYPPDIGERVWDAYGADERACFLAALVAGEPGGLCVALGHGDTLYLWAAAGFRERRGDNPTTALYVHTSLWALDHGYRLFDEVGTVDEGITRFKKTFGAVEVPYAVATRYHLRSVRQVRRGYRFLKGLRGAGS